jgi:molecular chaperone HtpG
MNITPQQTSIMTYLKSLNDVYYGKILELRDAVQNWLAYIPETFPHYTRHTVLHSDEIVVQTSKLLFRYNDTQPVINLSAAEAYILIAAAYLHDSGMVAADQEKLEILTSDNDWKSWIAGEGGGAKRWREIGELRQGKGPIKGPERHFVADLQTRFLIAEFIRRTHHLRAADVIKQYEEHLGRFAFGDPTMQRTIADICVAHGLRDYELEDREKYPEMRDVQGYPVNVRLLAILLRLGDLLDMSYDRACPLLMNAANPLPSDSLAHWEQYKRITHRATSPDRIEITAECENQEEHRVLQDWCQWIVNEVNNAKVLMNRAELHHEWQPPIALIDGPEATIKIRPAQHATYIPSSWTFELDHAAVFQLLIRDVYDNPLVFIRELIQNALDANRCQVYADLARDNQETPEYPTQVDEERRRRYPVKIKLETRLIPNEMSGETEEKQVLSVEDYGIGMDREIIQRYFLQVGRSFYTTDEFRRNFRFIPTSRFGIGFLSVFAVSDRVMVETYKPSSAHKEESIRLTLRGPRNYLLTEQGGRNVSGTRIEVMLREPLLRGRLTELVAHWCRRVEFPVFVDDLGVQRTIASERADQFTYEIPDVTKQGNKFAVRPFPINRPGIEGEIYVFVALQDGEELWDKWEYASSTYPKEHPQANPPGFPRALVCLHGINLDLRTDIKSEPGEGPLTAHLDYRSNRYTPTVARNLHHENQWLNDQEVRSRVEEILLEHLTVSRRANSADGWKYKQSLVDEIDLPLFWNSLPNMIPVYTGHQSQLLSLKDIQALKVLTVVASREELTSYEKLAEEDSDSLLLKEIEDGSTAITGFDLRSFSLEYRDAIFKNRQVVNSRWLTSEHLLMDWALCDAVDWTFAGKSYELVFMAKSPNLMLIGFSMNKVGLVYSSAVYLNQDHPFVHWLKVVKITCEQHQYDFNQEQFNSLMSLIHDVILYPADGDYEDSSEDDIDEELSSLNRYLEEWMKIPDLPAELYPPITKITPEMITLMKPDE